MRMLRNQPRNTQKELVNDFKVGGTIVTKKTVGKTLRSEGLKSCSACNVPVLKKAHMQARLKFATEHLNDSDEDWGESIVVRRDQSSVIWHELNSPCWEEEKFNLIFSIQFYLYSAKSQQQSPQGALYCTVDRTITDTEKNPTII
uniref:Transposase Tc1-like domain-containing protein n=1 Tax=Astatotilapia calliptera TaxID=8154 RepID=A0AAX7SYD0_ASTCA